MVTRMAVDPRHVKEFERILRLILKNTHTVGHVSTCVVKPARGEYTYTSIVRERPLSSVDMDTRPEVLTWCLSAVIGQVRELECHAPDFPE
jgi:hypothetical protein